MEHHFQKFEKLKNKKRLVHKVKNTDGEKMSFN